MTDELERVWKEMGHDHFLPNPFQSLFTSHVATRRYIVGDTDSAVK
jgi:hypothetical protein